MSIPGRTSEQVDRPRIHEWRITPICSFLWCFVRFGGDQLFCGESVQFGDSIIGRLDGNVWH